jgi:hypothetical protein
MPGATAESRERYRRVAESEPYLAMGQAGPGTGGGGGKGDPEDPPPPPPPPTPPAGG